MDFDPLSSALEPMKPRMKERKPEEERDEKPEIIVNVVDDPWIDIGGEG